eukprot:92471-Rhodomonas_salina.2
MQGSGFGNRAPSAGTIVDLQGFPSGEWCALEPPASHPAVLLLLEHLCVVHVKNPPIRTQLIKPVRYEPATHQTPLANTANRANMHQPQQKTQRSLRRPRPGITHPRRAAGRHALSLRAQPWLWASLRLRC